MTFSLLLRRHPVTSNRWLDKVVVAAAAVVFVYSAALMGRAVAASANSDGLYLAAMYRDVFVDGASLKTWYTQPAPSFFPDLPLFFLARALTGSSAAALWTYAITELVFGVVFIVGIARLLEVKNRHTAWTAALLSMSALAYFNSFGDCYHLGFSPSCHASCVWVSVGSALVIARQIKANRWRPRALLVLLLLTALTASSDHLYLVHATGLALALVFSLVVTRKGRARLLANVAAIGLGAALSRAFERLPTSLGIQVEAFSPNIDISWERVVHVLQLLPPPDHEPTAIAVNVGALAIAMVLALSVCAIVAAGHPPSRRAVTGTLTFFAAALVASIGCVLFGLAFCGVYWDGWSSRYQDGLFVYPYLALPVAWLLARHWALRLAIPTVVAVPPFVTGWPKVSKDMTPLLADSVIYPAPVACVDDIARRYGVRYGYADYWFARRTTELSKTGLHLVAVTPEVWAGQRIQNREWFEKVADASPFIVLTSRLMESAVRSKFGEPAHVESCEGCAALAGPGGDCGHQSVWVYSGRPRSRLLP